MLCKKISKSKYVDVWLKIEKLKEFTVDFTNPG